MKICAFLAVFAMAGCSSFPPRAAVQIPGGSKVNLSGDAATPAHVNETTTAATLPVPAQSTITTSPADGTVKVQVSAPTQLTVNTRNTKVDGPVAFTPPTPSQKEDAKVKGWLYVALTLGLFAAIFGLVEQWEMVMIAGAVVAVASVCGLFVVNHPAISYVIVGAVIFGLAGVYVYFRHNAKFSAPQPQIPQKP